MWFWNQQSCENVVAPSVIFESCFQIATSCRIELANFETHIIQPQNSLWSKCIPNKFDCFSASLKLKYIVQRAYSEQHEYVARIFEYENSFSINVENGNYYYVLIITLYND